MPARREYTAAELAERLERQREQTRQRVARYRARRGVTRYASGNADAVTVTATPLHAREDVRSTAPVTTIEEAVLRTACAPDAALSDLERIELLLAPYAGRRYVHRPASWERLLAGCVGVDPVLEVIRACEWLDEPAHRQRDCSFRFLSGWIKRAAQQQAVGPALSPQRPRLAPAPRRKPVGTEILEHLGYVAG